MLLAHISYPAGVASPPPVAERDQSSSSAHARDRRNIDGQMRLIVAWSVVAACALAALSSLPTQLRHTHSDIQVGSTRSRAERLEQPARTVGLSDLRVFEAADRIIPRNTDYVVVIGPKAGISDRSVLSWVRPYARYRLLPRKLIGDRRKAQWVISYGGDLTHLGLHYGRVVQFGHGMSLAKIEGSG